MEDEILPVEEPDLVIEGCVAVKREEVVKSTAAHGVKRHADIGKDHGAPACTRIESQSQDKQTARWQYINRMYECTACTYSSNSRQSIAQHISHIHGCHLKVQFICDKCDKTYTSKRGLKIHIDDKHNHKPLYRCSLCQKGFMSSISFKGHMNKHAGITQTCTKCGASFNYPFSFQRHVQKCGLKSSTKMRCAICNSLKADKQTLEYHIRAVHNNKCQFQCKCGQAFKWRSTLSSHRIGCDAYNSHTFMKQTF